MKKTIIITSVLVSILGFGANFIYDKFTQLNTQISNLKTKEKKLSKKNETLTKKQNDIKKKISQRKKDLFAKKLSHAKKKLARATTSAIPFVGTISVVGMTYLEMQYLCDDIKEFKEFEKSIFENSDNSISEEEKALCGYDYETIETIVLKDLNEVQTDTKDWALKTYDDLNEKISKELNQLKTEYME